MDGDSTYSNLLWGLDSATYSVYSSTTGSSWNCISGLSAGSRTQGVWETFAIRRNGTTIRTYENGAFVATAETSCAINGNAPIDFMRAQATSTAPMMIDDFVAYKRALTDAEIADWSANHTFFMPSTSNNAFYFNGSSYPTNNTNLAQSTVNFTQNATIVNNTMNCSLILDNQLNQTKQYSNLTNQSYFFTIDYFKPIGNGNHTYFISCKSLVDNTTTNTSLTYFNITYFAIVSQTYTENVTELDNTAFELNFSKLSEVLDINASLYWNNTKQNATKNNVSFTKIISIPLVETNNTKIPLYWNYTVYFADGTNQTYLTQTLNQTILWKYAYGTLNVTAKLYNNSIIQNFTINITCNESSEVKTTTLYNLTFRVIQGRNYTLRFSSLIANQKEANITPNSSFYNYQFIVYAFNSINISYKDLETKATINNVSLSLIGDIYSNNYSTTSGSINLELLSPENYILRSTSSGYALSSYSFNLQNNTHTDLILYLVKNTSASIVSSSVIDETNTRVPNVLIKVLKFDVSSNSYILQDVAQTNFEGSANLNLILNTEYYKFILEYPSGSVKLTTDATLITSTTLRPFQINLGSSFGNYYVKISSISSSLIFNQDTNNFRFTYTDANNIVSQACLKVFLIQNNKEIEYNSSCINSAAGSILVSVLNTSGKTYIAKSYAFFDGSLQFISSKSKTFPQSNQNGKEGLYAVFLLSLLFACMGYYNKTIALILLPLPSLFASLLNLAPIPVGLGLMIAVCCWGLALYISKY